MNKQVQGVKGRVEAATRDAISSFLRVFGAPEGDWGILRALRSPIHSPGNSDDDLDSEEQEKKKPNLRKRKLSTSSSNNGAAAAAAAAAASAAHDTRSRASKRTKNV